jgi:hypothetical protein
VNLLSVVKTVVRPVKCAFSRPGVIGGSSEGDVCRVPKKAMFVPRGSKFGGSSSCGCGCWHCRSGRFELPTVQVCVGCVWRRNESC